MTTPTPLDRAVVEVLTTGELSVRLPVERWNEIVDALADRDRLATQITNAKTFAQALRDASSPLDGDEDDEILAEIHEERSRNANDLLAVLSGEPE